jgi:hypothetical protein
MLNLTPHAIVVQANDGTTVTFPPSGTIARVSTKTVEASGVAGIPVIKTLYGAVEGIPSLPCEPFLVSGMVLGRLPPEYAGFAFAPATGPNDGAIRNDKGHIMAVTRLVTV